MMATDIRDANAEKPDWSTTAERTGASASTVELENEGGELRIVRVLKFEETTVARIVVWNATVDEPASLDDAREALSEDPARLRFWSVAAIALGEDWLTRQIEPVVSESVERRQDKMKRVEAKRQEAEDEARRDAEKETKNRELGLYFRERRGRYLLTLEREQGTLELWSIVFKEKWERDRFWDWFAWQTDRYERIVASIGEVLKVDIERDLLNEMLTTEQTIKKQGLGAGGRRPLRFWKGEK